MTLPHDFQAKEDDYGAEAHTASSLPIRSIEEGLNEIDRILRQMLLLAELSASDGTVDRDSLQKVIERLQNKIDRIADTIEKV